VLAQLKAENPDTLRVVYRHFPLTSIHDKAALAAQASEAAGLQGHFWEMHDLLFQQQRTWTGLSVEAFETWVIEQAGLLGLDEKQFTADMLSPEIAALAQAAWDEGVEIGIPGTPYLLINDRVYDGPKDYWSLTAILDLISLEKRQFTSCPEVVIRMDKEYIATIETEKGSVVLELYPQQTPIAVNNFVFLARAGWYDGATFHRVLEGFMAQTGDPSGTGFGGPGYAFINEISPDLTFAQPGVVAMANAGPDSNGSQFFITFAEASHLNGGYTIFGQVIQGQEVVDSLTRRDPGQGANLPPGDRIIRIIIEEK